MAMKRGLSGTGLHRNRTGRSRFPIVILIFFALLAPLIFFVGRGIHISTIDPNDDSSTTSKQNENVRGRPVLQQLKNVFSKEVVDVITANIDDSGPLNLDHFIKNNLSASWRIVGVDTTVEKNATPVEPIQTVADVKKQTLKDDRSQFVDTPVKLSRRNLIEKRRSKRAADLLRQDDEAATVKLENAAIERSKSVDSAVLGKYSIWRRENENDNTDATVRLMRDQLIFARVYLSIATMKNKLDLHRELQTRIKESQRALGEASSDVDLHQSAPEKIKAMGQVLSKARDQLYDCKLVTVKLRAMLQSADEQVRSLKKQSTFLSQLAAKTIPNGIHCLSMRLTIEYYLLPREKRKFPRSENLGNPNLYHYAIFSDNVLAASVVVNSTLMNTKEPSKMGGSVAVHVAAKKVLHSLAGLVVVDVVEGTAIASLAHMQKILSSRIQCFSTIEKAIEWSLKGGYLRNVESARISVPATLKYVDSKQCYILRAQLEETEQYWRAWYEGLSETFLSCPVPKLLLLAGTDRLDKALTIGQMQGKFQMVVVRHSGHAIQEDVPEEFANLIINFISRNRIGPHGVEIPGLRRPSQQQT